MDVELRDRICRFSGAVHILFLMMGKIKNHFWACNKKHYPPTSKNCQNAYKIDQDNMAGGSSGVTGKDVRDSPSSQVMTPESSMEKSSSKSIAPEKDSNIKRVQTPGHIDQSDSDIAETGRETRCQQQIPDELKKVSTTLDVVEAQMVEGRTSDKTRRKNGGKISTVSKHSK